SPRSQKFARVARSDKVDAQRRGRLGTDGCSGGRVARICLGSQPTRLHPQRWKVVRKDRVILVVATVYLAVILFGHLPDHLILFPTKATIDAGGAVRKTVPFQNGELELWTAESHRAKQNGRADIYILRFYGNADRAERWVAAEADEWNDRAVEIWGMNYPGFGGSTGPARLSRIGRAALTAFDELQRHVNSQPIVLYGASLGACAALTVAARRPAAGLILHNPPPLRQMILRQFGWWNLWLLAGPISFQIPRELANGSNAKAIHAPAVVLLAEED